jgi:hypothetical protein
MISPCVLTLLFATLASVPAAAGPLYKWTDSAGRVTYASSPPAGVSAVLLAVPPPPSEDEVREAKARLERVRAQLARLEDARRAREEEEARLRALQQPAPPIIVERPVYVPQPAIYIPVLAPAVHRDHEPRPRRPRADRDERRR